MRERRVVVALFVDISGFTSMTASGDVEDVHEIVRAAFDSSAAIVRNQGGVIESYMGDALFALFGADRAHRDDSDRAIRTAIEIRSVLTDQGLTMHAGIEMGEALVDLERLTNERDLMALGDVINMAARLEQAAPRGEIYIGPTAASHSTAQLSQLSPISVKGHNDPLPAWRVIGSSGFEVEARLFGRESELKLCADILERVASEGAPRVLQISGPPGIGKTSLLLAAYAGGNARIATCRPPGEQTSAEIFRALVAPELVGNDLIEAIATAHAARGGADPLRIAQLIALSCGVGSGKSQLASVVVNDAGKAREVIVAWREYLSALANQTPVTIVLDSAQWLPPDVLAVVQSILGASAPILVALCAWNEIDVPSTHIALASLRDEAAAEIARQFAPEDHIPRIVQQAEGNPLFIEELSRAPSERLPLGLRAAIDARIDLLPKAEKAILGAASVVGSLDPETLRAVSEFDAGQLAAALQSLRHEGIVEGPSFRSRLTSEVMYARITRADRRALHSKAAEHFRNESGLRAHHLEGAERWEDAVAAFREAAADAARRAALHESSRHLTRAITISKEHPLDPGLDAELHVELGSSLFALNQLELAQEAFSDAIMSTASLDTKARALAGRSTARFWNHDLDGAHSDALEAYSLPSRSFASAEASVALAFVRASLGSSSEASDLADQAEHLANDANSSRLKAFVGMLQVFVHHHAGRSLQASAMMERVASECRREGLPGPLMWTLFKGGLAHAATGEFSKALDAWDRLDKLAQQTESPWYAAEASNCRGHVFRELGELNRADEYDHQCLELADSKEESEARANALLNLAASAIMRNDIAQVQRYLLDVEPLLENRDFFRWRYLQRLRYYKARVAILQDRQDDAIDIMTESLASGRMTGGGKNIIRPQLVLASIRAREEPLAGARELIATGDAAQRARLLPLAWRAYGGGAAHAREARNSELEAEGRQRAIHAAQEILTQVPHEQHETFRRTVLDPISSGSESVWKLPL